MQVVSVMAQGRQKDLTLCIEAGLITAFAVVFRLDRSTLPRNSKELVHAYPWRKSRGAVAVMC